MGPKSVEETSIKCL